MKDLGHGCLVLFAGVALLARGEEEILPGAKRVLFLGDSITYSGQYVEFIEAYFATRWPNRTIEFLNLGLPSETVSGLSEEGHAGGRFPRPDLHERLARVLQKTKPDTVLACYGMNDGIYLPFAPVRFAAFSNGLVRLREGVAAAGAKLIHVTPPVFDEARGQAPGYANTLDRYSEWLLSQRAAGWDVVDLHEPMKRVLLDRRKTDPRFFLASDGVHVGDFGHWIMARQILRHLGALDWIGVEGAADLVRGHPHGAQILKLVQQKQRLLKDAWLTDIGHQRPGMNKGLPLAEARVRAAELDAQIRALAKPPATGRPLIRKLGTIDLDMVETTPVVLNGRLWRFEWVRQGVGQQYWNNARQTNYFRFRDPANGAVTAPFAEGHEFGSAFVEGDTVYVTGTQGRNRVNLFASRNLETWESWPVIEDPRYGIFNTSLAKAGSDFVLAFEIDKPRDETGHPFTIRFTKSPDLRAWTVTAPECNFTKERYSAAPCLRWDDGWFYLFYLEAHQGYETRVVRSRELVQWEASPLNPVLRASAEDKQLANLTLTAEQHAKISAAKNINNSDLDFCEWQGRLVIQYSWGNQQGTEFLAQALYDGTQETFLRGWFPNR